MAQASDAKVGQSPFDALPQAEKLACLRELAEGALAYYDVGAASAPVLLNLSENATYRIDDFSTGRRWALRVHREGYHSKNAIASELAWATALRADGVVTTPVPLPGRDGKLIQEAGHPAMPRPRNVVLLNGRAGLSHRKKTIWSRNSRFWAR